MLARNSTTQKGPNVDQHRLNWIAGYIGNIAKDQVPSLLKADRLKTPIATLIPMDA